MLDAAEYTLQYELLRLQIIGTGGQARGIGLALLLNEGMPGWLRAVERVLPSSLAPRKANPANVTPHEVSMENVAVPAWPSIVQRHEVAALLANLVLSTHPVACQSSREVYRS
jgi:hypothetical protein